MAEAKRKQEEAKRRAEHEAALKEARKKREEEENKSSADTLSARLAGSQSKTELPSSTELLIKMAYDTEDAVLAQIKEGEKEINVVLKADVNGSLEAVKNALEKIDVEGVKVSVIRGGVGAITESDVVLANASNAIIIGFNVVPSNITKEIAKEYNVDIRLYTIIYKAVEEMELAMKGMLDPEFEEKVLGTVEIRQIFKFSKVGLIAGCHVTSGTVKNGQKARIIPLAYMIMLLTIIFGAHALCCLVHLIQRKARSIPCRMVICGK